MSAIPNTKVSVSAIDSVGPARQLPIIGFILLLTFVAHFLRLHEFGLYEDDYWSIMPSLNGTESPLWERFKWVMLNWPQGRPLNHFMPQLLGTTAGLLGGLTTAYLIAWLWFSGNVFLVYRIGCRLRDARLGLAAAAVYTLFPADTTRILLTHVAHLQGAMTFCLLGTLLWLRQDRWHFAGYPVALLCLTAYESTFLPFMALPLLRFERSRTFIFTVLRHAAICAALLGFCAFVRIFTGDSRLQEATGNQFQSIQRAFFSLGLGPWTSAKQLLLGPFVGWQNINATVVLATVLILPALWIAFASLRASVNYPTKAATQPRFTNLQIALFASFAWVFAYALTLINYPPTQTLGRLTSTHLAPALGCSLLVALLWHQLWSRTGRQRIAANLVGTVWICAALAYTVFVQAGYVESYVNQRNYWRAIVRATPDVEANWSVIVVGENANSTSVIAANSWADDHVFGAIVRRNDSEHGPDFANLALLSPDTVHLTQTKTAWTWQPQFWGGPTKEINPLKLALIRYHQGVAERVSSLEIAPGLLVSDAPLPRQPRTTLPPTFAAELLAR